MTKKQRRMKKAIRYLADYMATYDQQVGCTDYSDSIFIDDVLYGLGVALDKKYEFADGYDEFKKKLIEHLQK